MTKLRKFLFILFIFSVLAGHGIAEANSPGKKFSKACDDHIKAVCSNFKGKVPMFPKTAPAKKCSSEHRGSGFTFQVFKKNVPKQQASKDAATHGKAKAVCETAKTAHKSCHIIVKKGKTVLKDTYLVFDNKGDRKCDQVRKQVNKKGEAAKNLGDSQVALRDSNSGENKKNPNAKRRRRLADLQQTGVVTKDTTPKSAR